MNTQNATALSCKKCLVIHIFDDSAAEERYANKNNGLNCNRCGTPMQRQTKLEENMHKRGLKVRGGGLISGA